MFVCNNNTESFYGAKCSDNPSSVARQKKSFGKIKSVLKFQVQCECTVFNVDETTTSLGVVIVFCLLQ